MPNCFSLQRKSDPKAGNVPFSQIDEELCKLFEVPVHEKYYIFGWYDCIGFKVAMGKKLPEIREGFEEMKLEYQTSPTPNDMTAEMIEWCDGILKVTDYLIENYTTDAWAEIGRRSA